MKLELTELQAEMLRRLDNAMTEALNCGLGDILDKYRGYGINGYWGS